LRSFYLPFREWRRLSRRAYAAQQNGQMEIAGLLASDVKRRLSLFFLKNESDRPGHFELSWEQRRAGQKVIASKGLRFLGIFHSHPVWYAVMGPGDKRGARPNEFHLIYDVCGREARLWKVVLRHRRKNPLEVPLVVERSKPKNGG